MHESGLLSPRRLRSSRPVTLSNSVLSRMVISRPWESVLSCHPASVLSHVSSSVLSRTVISRLWESVLGMQSAFVTRSSSSSLIMFTVSALSVLLSASLSVSVSVPLSVSFSVSFYLSSSVWSLRFSRVPVCRLESVYRPPRYICRLVLSIEFVVLSSHLSCQFSVSGFVFCYHVHVFRDFVVKSVSLVSLSRLVVVFLKSRYLVSFSCYVCMFCGILDCFGLFWISVSTLNRKGRSVLKKGRDGRNSCTGCHSVMQLCSGPSLNPPSKTPSKKILFGSVSIRPVSHTVICLLSCRNSRSLGLFHSV